VPWFSIKVKSVSVSSSDHGLRVCGGFGWKAFMSLALEFAALYSSIGDGEGSSLIRSRATPSLPERSTSRIRAFLGEGRWGLSGCGAERSSAGPR